MHVRAQSGRRLGFASNFGQDGHVSEELLIGIKEAGYHGIEPNCLRIEHLHGIAEICNKLSVPILAIPTGRWMNTDDAPRDYGRYTKRAFDYLNEGAAIAATLDVPLIIGLIRGLGSIRDGEAKTFLRSTISQLTQTTPALKVLLEPVTPDEVCWPRSLHQGAQLLEELDNPNVTLLADSYHLVRSGETAKVESYRHLIGHLHIRDDRKQVRTVLAPEYIPLLRLWSESNLVLSFEIDTDLRNALSHAMEAAGWITSATGQLQ